MKQRTTKSPTMPSSDIAACTTIAVDLAKHVFQIAAEDDRGRVVYEQRITSRAAFHEFLRTLRPGTVVVMETGPGAQAWAREAQSSGKQVRVLPAQRVAEHRSGAKNDRKDAHAILRAHRDCSIAAVPVKSVEALAMQALHRVRKGMLRRRTAIGNQVRGLLLEHDIALPKGPLAMTDRLDRILEDATQPIPMRLREVIADLQAEWRHLSERLTLLTAKLERSAAADATAQRLMTVRGIGPINATALVAKEVLPERFANARQFAAYFGLVPDQHSSGKTIRLGKMAKRGDRYLRGTLIEGAHSVLRRLDPDSAQPDDRRLQRWLQRHGRKGAAVRLANRNLRIVWALLQNTDTYQRQPAPRGEVTMHA